MKRNEIIKDLQTRDKDWLESCWSVLDEAIKAIEPHLTEVETAFDYDYTCGDDKNILEELVCGQVLEMCCIVTISDVIEVHSWHELRNLIDDEIKKRG